jgi:large subunit ribosomal protein L24
VRIDSHRPDGGLAERLAGETGVCANQFAPTGWSFLSRKSPKDDGATMIDADTRSKHRRFATPAPALALVFTLLLLSGCGDQVIVEGVNTAKKHQRPRGQTMQGGVIDKDMPVHVSNVMIFCEECDKPTRIGYRFDDNGKHRICRRCGSDL